MEPSASNSATGARQRRMMIGGELVAAASGAWMQSINPATEDVVGFVPRGAAEDVDRAVRAAQEAQGAWSELPVAERSRLLHALADAIARRSEEILQLEVADTGNSITGMKGDISSCIARIRHFAGLGHELQGRTIPEESGKLNLTLREPFGVVGRIVAFNHPFAMAAHGAAAPLMAGNCIVIKPSDQCPLSATLLGEIAREVLPPGVLNIVTGGAEVGSALVRHPVVKRLSFVGSVRTGMAIQRSAAEVAVKSLSLELGGKNPFIVYPDAPLDAVADAAVRGMNFIWQGQSCNSTSRLFVHDDVYDEIVPRVAALAERIRIGDPRQWSTQMGALISREHLERVEGHLRGALDEGARLVAGGSRPSGAPFDKGFWFRPTVLADVTQQMKIAQEEVFGPILSILRWSEVDQVIEMANSVDVGLTGAVWTRDLSSALRTAKRLHSGYIWINGINAQGRGVPFGGYKNSGIGRERGIEELYSYTEEKSLQVFI